MAQVRPRLRGRDPGRVTGAEPTINRETPGSSERGSDDPPKVRTPKQEQEPASEEVTEVAPGILRMQLPIWMPGLGHVNTYILEDDRGIAVVDPGLPGPASWKAMKSRLKSAGYRVRDIHTVIVTHSHPDHFGGAGRIRRTADAELITHEAFTTWSFGRRGATLSADEAQQIERAAIEEAANYHGPPIEELPAMVGEGDGAAPVDAAVDARRRSVAWGTDTPWGGAKHPMPPFRRRVLIRALRLLFNPPDPTRRVRHGAVLELGGREWVAIHTPGHTVDHLCLFDPEGGVLLAGDHVLPTITPHIAGSSAADSLASYLATLDLVASLDGVRLGLPAHGHPFTDVAGRVQAIKDHHLERTERIRAASAALGPLDVVGLSHEVFPERHWGVMAESETFAHLEHLVSSGWGERWRDGDRFVYRF